MCILEKIRMYAATLQNTNKGLKPSLTFGSKRIPFGDQTWVFRLECNSSHFCSTSVPWEKFKHASKTRKHMKQYQHFTEALFIALLGFLFINSALIMLVSRFIIFTGNSVINLITDEQ